MKHAILLTLAFLAVGCNPNPRNLPPVGSTVEVELVDWDVELCYYRWPNGQIGSLWRNGLEVDGKCPEHTMAEVEE